jgi:hypothetical protein
MKNGGEGAQSGRVGSPQMILHLRPGERRSLPVWWA